MSVARRRAVVVLFAVFTVLVMFLPPMQASSNVHGAFAEGVSKGDLVGVKVGDWVKYSVSSTGPIGMPEGYVDWIRIDVQNASSPFVVFRRTTHFKSGNENNDTIITDLRIDTASMYIIATNHNVGNRVLVERFNEIFINDTVSKNYLGVNREAYKSIYSFDTSFFNDRLHGTQEWYWDKQTGFLLETNRSVFIIGYENTTLSRWSMEIASTNLWEINSQPLSSQLRLLTLMGVPIGITIVITFIKIRKKTKKIEE